MTGCTIIPNQDLPIIIINHTLSSTITEVISTLTCKSMASNITPVSISTSKSTVAALDVRGLKFNVELIIIFVIPYLL